MKDQMNEREKENLKPKEENDEIKKNRRKDRILLIKK